MREWERLVFAEGGISERVVMESAGRAAAAAIADAFPDGRVVAAVGRGMNGGDAIVALRTLKAWGRDVLACPVGESGFDRALAHGWEIPTEGDPEHAFRAAGVVVDGILGTGATGAPRGPIATVVRTMNAADRPIVALDGPTGVDLTTGEAAGEAVAARLTVTFGALKRGLLLHPGRRLAGRILLAEVGFPPLDGTVASAGLVTDAWARARLPRVPPDAHKGSAGIVAVAAGRRGVGGAVIMAAMGALRSGCGGVRVISDAANRAPVQTAVPEAVFFDRAGEDRGGALERTAAALIGPGIGTDEEGLELLGWLLSEFRGPLVIDADALTLLSREPSLLTPEVAVRCVLTPHPGELGRLLGVGAAEVARDPLTAATAAAERFGATVLAKGAPSLVAAPSRATLLSLAGHSGVATGGMGDTLAGIVAALLAAGAPPRAAAGMGVHFAGRAAERAGRGRGLLPRDVAEALPAVLREPDGGVRPAAPFLLDLEEAR